MLDIIRLEVGAIIGKNLTDKNECTSVQIVALYQ
jgi:hypothetical protein